MNADIETLIESVVSGRSVRSVVYESSAAVPDYTITSPEFAQGPGTTRWDRTRESVLDAIASMRNTSLGDEVSTLFKKYHFTPTYSESIEDEVTDIINVGEFNNWERRPIKESQLPSCSYCERVPQYEGKTDKDDWSFMCESHYQLRGIGLGLGVGQKLHVIEG